MPNIQLTDKGGDRATGYAMNNKLVTLSKGLLCTWLDAGRQNRWALIDRYTGVVRREGSIGRPTADNHCGITLAVVDETVHAVVGAHHGPFEHYVWPAAHQDTGDWQHQATIEMGRGTYPALVADAEGRLHLACRTADGEHWSLKVARFEAGHWLPPQTLLLAQKRGYVYWTNGLTVTPDGTVHLICSNTRVLPHQDLLYSASHLYSPDGGQTWHNTSGELLNLPAATESIPLLTPENEADRILLRNDQPRFAMPGPHNIEYRQMLLSNPVPDQAGRLHVILHNCLSGTAALMSYHNGGWQSRPLPLPAALNLSNYRIHPQSSLSCDHTGTLHAALMLEPTSTCVWGPPGTVITYAQIQPGQTAFKIDLLTQPDPAAAQWLPALEHPGPHGLAHKPALLYTYGINAGGFQQNQNTIHTRVYLQTHATDLTRISDEVAVNG